MAETAKLMSPNKKVLLPDMKQVVHCHLQLQVKMWDVKREVSRVPVVSYVNTSADVKAETDVLYLPMQSKL